jgi:hypothetical protein
MSHRTLTLAVLAGAALAAACADRTPVDPREMEDAALTAAVPGVPKPERLARAFAQALRSPVFRAYLKAQLDASPFAEHKLQFQSFLDANGGRARRHLAEASGRTEADVAREAGTTIALEVYLPVPAHRAAWTGGGDENILVATAIADRDVPVAFDVRGGRRLLDPDTPPPAGTPVLALVPVETDFTAAPQRLTCLECGGDGGTVSSPPPPPAPGLYMTKAHFVKDFEGWLKGNPEFEVHVLGQKGQTDSLLSYQCSGERRAAPYFFNQDNLDWSGSVLLFSTTQIDQYNAAHPGQNVRVFVVEDDDTPCEIKTGKDTWTKLLTTVDAANQTQTAGKDTTSSTLTTIWKYAKAAIQLYHAVASLIMTNDELVGNAVQDVIAGEFHTGFNWIVKGDKNVTNGWINLEMK